MFIQEQPKGPETILELAYLQDPKLFNRDGETRRSKARADLKAQTGIYMVFTLLYIPSHCTCAGWTDEQIEGWRIMLERNVSHYSPHHQ